MPEVRFRVRWPDGREQDCYSPSRAIEQHLQLGAEYTLQEFLERSRVALHVASERVRAKFGFTCSAALDQLAELEAVVSEQTSSTPEGRVQVLEFIHGGQSDGTNEVKDG